MVEDEETLEVGFLENVDDHFWVYEDDKDAFVIRRFKGRHIRRGPPRGKGKGKGRKGRSRMFNRRRKGKGKGKGRSRKGKGYSTDDWDWNSQDWTDDGGWYDANFGFGGKKGKKGKGKFKGKGKDFSHFGKKGKGKKGDGKGKDGKDGKGKDGKGMATDNNTPVQPSQSNDQTDQSWWQDDSWTWWSEWDSGWANATDEWSWSEPGWEQDSFATENNYMFIAQCVETDQRSDCLGVGDVMEQYRIMRKGQTEEIFLSKALQSCNLIELRSNPTYVIMDFGCTRSMGSLRAVNAFIWTAWYSGITHEWKRCNTKMSFANSQTETLNWCVVVTWPTTPPVSTTIDVHESGDIPILMSLPQMMNLGMSLTLDSNGIRVTCPAMGYNDHECAFSTSRHAILDLAAIKYNTDAIRSIFMTTTETPTEEETSVFQ